MKNLFKTFIPFTMLLIGVLSFVIFSQLSEFEKNNRQIVKTITIK
jgi:hypothetical protein